MVIQIHQPTDLVTIPKAAKQLGHHKTTLYRWHKHGKIYLVELGGILFMPSSEVERVRKQKEAG